MLDKSPQAVPMASAPQGIWPRRTGFRWEDLGNIEGKSMGNHAFYTQMVGFSDINCSLSQFWEVSTESTEYLPMCEIV